MNNLTVRIAKTKEPINPKSSKKSSSWEKDNFVSKISRVVAPIIVGTAKINENSAAVFLFIPAIKAPIMLAPALEVPGIIDID